MSTDLQSADLVGRLVLSESRHDPDKYWLKLQVPQALIHGFFAALPDTGLSKPAGQAHISVANKDEVEKIGVSNITEVGKNFHFRITGLKHVRPQGWSEMSRVWFITCTSPELCKLRASYGLTALPYGNHPWHCTIAVRKAGVLAPNASITKHAFVGREALIGAGLGAGAGGMADLLRKKKEKSNWLHRHAGMLLGGLGGAGVGALLPRSNTEKDVPETKPESKDVPLSISSIKPVQSDTPPIAPAQGMELGTNIPDYLRQGYTGEGSADTVGVAPVTSSLAENVRQFSRDQVDPIGMTLISGVGAGVGAVRPAAGVGRWISALRNAAKYPTWGLSAIGGAAAGATGMEALEDRLGVKDPVTRTINEVGAAGAGGMAANKGMQMAGRKAMEWAGPTVRRWAPELSAKLLSSAPEAGKGLLSRAGTVARSRLGPKMYPAMVITDLAATLAKQHLAPDAARGDAVTEMKQQMDDATQYGTLGGGLKTVGRALLQPGKTVNLASQHIGLLPEQRSDLWRSVGEKYNAGR